MTLKIEDQRRGGYVDLRDDRQTNIKIGDVVETEGGRLALVVWADWEGRPCASNPGHPGLLYLSNFQSCTICSQFPKVRKLKAKLVIEEDRP